MPAGMVSIDIGLVGAMRCGYLREMCIARAHCVFVMNQDVGMCGAIRVGGVARLRNHVLWQTSCANKALGATKLHDGESGITVCAIKISGATWLRKGGGCALQFV